MADRSLFEVVEHAFLQNEPPLVLRLVLAALLGEPALSLWVEESLRQVTVSVGDLELLFLHIIKQILPREVERGYVRITKYGSTWYIRMGWYLAL